MSTTISGQIALNSVSGTVLTSNGATSPATFQQPSGAINVKTYGALGNTISYPGDVTTTAASTTVVSNGAITWRAGLNGRFVSIGQAGSASAFTIASATNATPIVCSITLASSTAVYTPLVSGLKIVMTGNSNTAANGTFYAKYISGSGTGPYVIQLYTDSELTIQKANNGTSGGGGAGNIPTTFVTTITGGSGTSFTLAAAPTFSVSNALWTIGTDDTTAINSAIAAVPSGGGCLYFPAGNYFLAASSTNTTNAAITINQSNVTIRGDGMGVSTITKAYEAGIILQANGNNAGNGNFYTDITITNLTVTYGGTVIQRTGLANGGIQAQGQYSGGNTSGLKNITVRDCEVYNVGQGINYSSNVNDSRIIFNYVHDTLADGCSCYGVSAPNNRILISGNNIVNSGDDSVSDNSYTSSTGSNTNIIITDNISINSGSRGMATVGSSGCNIANNTVVNPFLSGIVAFAGLGFYSIGYTSITNNQIFGAGQGTPGLASVGDCCGILVTSADGTTAANNIIVSGNVIGPSSLGNNIGPAIGIFSVSPGATHICNNHQVLNNRIIGPFSTYGGSVYQLQGNVPNSIPAVYIDNGDNSTVIGNTIQQSYGEAVYVGQYEGGNVNITNNIIDTPNTHGTSNLFAIWCRGGNAPIVQLNSMRLAPSTILQLENIQPIGPVSQSGNFGTSGSLSGVNTTPGTGYSALTWATTGTVTQAAGNIITFTGASSALLTINKADSHVSVIVPTSPGAAGQLFIVLAANYDVDVYTGAIYYGYTLLRGGISSYTQANGDTIEAIYTTGLLEVWATSSGTRTKINSAYIGRLAESQITCGLQTLATTSGTISNFNLRY